MPGVLVGLVEAQHVDDAELPGHGRVLHSVTQASGQAAPQARQDVGGLGEAVAGLDLGRLDVEGAAVGADRLVVDDPEVVHRSSPLPGVCARISRARSAGPRAWPVIQVSAQALWQGTSGAGDRQTVGVPHSTHGASGPMLPCRQSRTTRAGATLAAWDMPELLCLRGRGTAWLACPRHLGRRAGGQAVPPDQAQRRVVGVLADLAQRR